jgi:hypothetical protein
MVRTGRARRRDLDGVAGQRIVARLRELNRVGPVGNDEIGMAILQAVDRGAAAARIDDRIAGLQIVGSAEIDAVLRVVDRA